MKHFTVAATLLLCACATTGAGRGAPSPLAPLAWMSGTWVGGEDGAHVEETWSAPSGVSMLGSFRMLQDGAPQFYELMTLEREGDQTLLRLKHFGPRLMAWEEKDEAPTFHLGRVAGTQATFENAGDDKVRRIRYARAGDGLTISLEREGQAPQQFHFQRADD